VEDVGQGSLHAARADDAHPPDERAVIRIRPGSSGVNVRELLEYRELLYYLVRRDLMVRYVQTVLGFGWAIVQPLVTVVVFTIFFGRLAEVDSQGVPYPLFSLAALVPWTYFASALNVSAGSVTGNAGLISKVYFPRLFLPLSPLLAVFVDFLIAFGVLAVVLAASGRAPTVEVVALPLLVVIMITATVGLGLLLAALGSRYRDVRYATPFFVQLLLFLSPVIYSASIVPTPERYLYALNPMVGVVEGFRTSLLGTAAFPWGLVGVSAASATLLLIVGIRVFSRTARHFADLA